MRSDDGPVAPRGGDGAVSEFAIPDANGVTAKHGDRVRFKARRSYFRMGIGREPDESWEEDVDAEGELRFSPYRGAYIVFEGHCHRVTKPRWFEVIQP